MLCKVRVRVRGKKKHIEVVIYDIAEYFIVEKLVVLNKDGSVFLELDRDKVEHDAEYVFPIDSFEYNRDYLIGKLIKSE
ncbi:MAG: hypothetical protein DRO40_08615 [Thermoprotei archaeon]|nr:MAG: hypothetical protein DRO40_08615 [Thermoprotei archaeon]